MINEGIVGGDTRLTIKSEMVRQIQALGRATPDQWERVVFRSVTGGKREDIDWDVEDNQAGYYAWVKSFDGLIEELVDDGFVRRGEENGEALIVAEDVDLPVGWSQTSDSGGA